MKATITYYNGEYEIINNAEDALLRDSNLLKWNKIYKIDIHR